MDAAILTIDEGKKRQIRRMFDTLGNYVVSIHRLEIGDLNLENYNVQSGKYKEISKEEILQKCF